MKYRSMLALMVILAAATLAFAGQTAPADVQIQAAGGKLTMDIPETWKAKPPKVRIIEHEFELAPAEGDKQSGRLTMMSAGGSVDANLERWKQQMKLEQEPRPEQLEVDGQVVHLIDLSGTYMDRRGPFGPATPRPGYRMLGAVIELKQGGLFFLKLYGPKATIQQHAAGFRAAVESMKSR